MKTYSHAPEGQKTEAQGAQVAAEAIELSHLPQVGTVFPALLSRFDVSTRLASFSVFTTWLQQQVVRGVIALRHSINPEPFYRWVARSVIQLIYRPKFIGFEQIPEEGGCVLIANHVSYLDGLLINAASKRRVRYVIDKQIYQQPLVNYFMKHNKAIPIFPKKEDVEAALDEISRGLKNGDIVCIFPEGRLTYTGYIGRFKPGIEYIIERDPVPVIPIAIEGLWGSILSRKYLNARFRWMPRSLRPDVRVLCGYPIPPEKVKVDKLQKIVLSLLRKVKTLQ